MYIIQKKTRARENPTILNAYCNPETCKKAGVKPGKIYYNFTSANEDAKKLSQINPIGFVVTKVEIN